MTLARHTRFRRPGLTLTEALVAMFVAAIGLIALMTLFPLGALQMSKALGDERALQTALQADGLVRAHWRSEVVEKQRPNARPGYPQSNEPDPLVLALDNPNFNVYQRPSGTGTEYINIYPGIYSRYTAFFSPTVMGGPMPGVPSFPVVIDPIGWQAREGLTPPKQYDQPWVGGRQDATPMTPTQPLPLPRRSLARFQAGSPQPYVGTPTWGAALNPQFSTNRVIDNSVFRNSLRFATLLDDLTYDETGTSAPAADLNPVAVAPPPGSPLEMNTGKVERQGRFNWMAIIQRPDSQRLDDVDLTIGVFDGRAPGYAPSNQELVYPRDNGLPVAALPFTQLIVFQPGSRSVRVYYAGEKPPILKGKWVLDGTLEGSTLAPALGGFNVFNSANTNPFDPDDTTANWQVDTILANQPHLRHANFYRVVTATEGTDTARLNATYVDLELEAPIKQRSDGSNAPYATTLYVLPGLTEVFRRPPMTK